MRVALVSHSSTLPILKVKDEIRSVGLKYQLATKFTSFVGVDQLRSGSLWQGSLVTRQVNVVFSHQSHSSFHPHHGPILLGPKPTASK